MKNIHIKSISKIGLVIFSLFISCSKDESKSKIVSPKKNSKLITKTSSKYFFSELKPNEKLTLGKAYTDTVTFIKLDDNGDSLQLIVSKNNKQVSLISNENLSYLSNEKVQIIWKIDSIRYAGDNSFINYREFLLFANKIRNNNTVHNFDKIKHESFVFSCGTGCAMAHNVKKIERISKNIAKITFSVDNYINEEIIETFDTTYFFYNGNSKKIEMLNSNGKKQNIENALPKNAIETLQEFRSKLFN